MRVGIDFGTTHTVVAVVDRGNYPVVSFDGVDAWPSLIAANAAGQLRFGSDAAAVRRQPRSSSPSTRPSTTGTTSGASRSAGGTTDRMSRSGTSSPPAVRWK
jgi:actin-like ATPase involved in cell morphogenesis